MACYDDYTYEPPGSYEFSVGGVVVATASVAENNDLLDYYVLTQYLEVPAHACPEMNVFELHLKLDGHETETSWDIKNAGGEKVLGRGEKESETDADSKGGEKRASKISTRAFEIKEKRDEMWLRLITSQ